MADEAELPPDIAAMHAEMDVLVADAQAAMAEGEVFMKEQEKIDWEMFKSLKETAKGTIRIKKKTPIL